MGAARRVRGGRSPADAGASLIDLVLALGISLTMAAAAVPATGAALDEGRARQAAAFIAAQFRGARQQAAARTASTALVFDVVSNRWTFRVCVDGNANGVRRTDLRSGQDTCAGGPTDLAALFPGVSIAVDDTIRGPDDDPPSSDPVRFGSANIASFSSSGTCSAGSLFIRSPRGVQFAVRIAGGTGRLRVLRYDAAARTWRTA